MQTLENLKNVLLDLNRNQLKFSAQLSEFEALQAHVGTLEQRARLDPEAARKWRSVNAYMAREGQQSQRQIEAQVGAFERNLTQVRAHLATLIPAEPAPLASQTPASLGRTANKHSRNFV